MSPLDGLTGRGRRDLAGSSPSPFCQPQKARILYPRVILTYTKRMICLAKSKKLGATCVAGLEWDGTTRGEWVRPVGDRLSEAIVDEEMTFESGEQVSLLDVVEIDFLEHRPHACQVENHLIADDYRWRKVGELQSARLRELAEEPPDLWGTDNHGYIRDRIPAGEADALTSSLMLVRLESPTAEVKVWPERTTVRVGFNYRGFPYNMTATDPAFKGRFVRKGEGTYKLANETFACLSLGEPDNGFRFKLAAAVSQVD